MRRSKTNIVCLLIMLFFSCCSGSRKYSSTEVITSSSSDDLPSASADKTAEIPPPSTSSPVELQKKYASFLKTSPESVTNIRLYQFIDQWLYTPYKWGGIDKRGIDCSAFMQRLYNDVYNMYIPRTSVDQFFAQWVDRFASHADLAEGDLVFFKTMKGKAISHVGFYLGNRRFVNSSSSKGVSIGNLDDPYWSSKYVAAGRIKQSLIRKAHN